MRACWPCTVVTTHDRHAPIPHAISRSSETWHRTPASRPDRDRIAPSPPVRTRTRCRSRRSASSSLDEHVTKPRSPSRPIVGRDLDTVGARLEELAAHETLGRRRAQRDGRRHSSGRQAPRRACREEPRPVRHRRAARAPRSRAHTNRCRADRSRPCCPRTPWPRVPRVPSPSTW